MLLSFLNDTATLTVLRLRPTHEHRTGRIGIALVTVPFRDDFRMSALSWMADLVERGRGVDLVAFPLAGALDPAGATFRRLCKFFNGSV